MRIGLWVLLVSLAAFSCGSEKGVPGNVGVGQPNGEPCVSSCVVGVSACLGESRRALCVVSPEGCAFETEVECGLGTACLEGACVAVPPADPCEGLAEAPGEACDVGFGVCLRPGATVCVEGAVYCASEPIPPSGRELCGDGVDSDCDGVINEGFEALDAQCGVGEGACAGSGHFVCSEDGLGLVCEASEGSPSPETCNGLDDDCDGDIDESCGSCGRLVWSSFDEVSEGIPAPSLAHVTGGVVRLDTVTEDGVPRMRLNVIDDGGESVETVLGEGVRSADVASSLRGDVVFAGIDGTERPVVSRWDLESGSEVWSRRLGREVAGGTVPSLAVGEFVAVAMSDAEGGWVEHRGLDDGELAWSTQLAGSSPRAMALLSDGDLVVVGQSAGGVLIVRLRGGDGAVVWQEVLGQRGDGAWGVARVDASRVVVTGRRGGQGWIAVLDVETGSVGWETDWEGGDRLENVSVSPAGRFLVAGQSGDPEAPEGFALAFVEGQSQPVWSASWQRTDVVDAVPGNHGEPVVVGVGGLQRRTVVQTRGFAALCEDGVRSPRVRVYILAGQSNMDGHGLIADLPVELRSPQPEVMMYWASEGELGPLRPVSNAAVKFGPEVAFGRALARAHPGDHVALIKYAIGGTNLHTQWYPGTRAGDFEQGPLYQVFVTVFYAGMAALRAEGFKPEVEGMIWMQGESDGGEPGVASAYAGNLRRFIQRVREDFEVPVMPFVVGKIQAPTVRERETIRAAQEQVAREVHNVSIVGTDDLPLGDAIHYNAEGQLTLGSRFASELLHHEEEPIPPPPEPVEPVDVVDEAGGYELVLDLDIPGSANWGVEADVPYRLDRRGELAEVDFERVAYWLELMPQSGESTWVWVSMPMFDEGVGGVGVPVDVVIERSVDGMRVRSNVPGVGPLDGAPGSLEFWSHCYATGPDGAYDSNDARNDTPDCYGSMQIHSGAGPVLSFNRWSNPSQGLDLGIGASQSEQPDWTFANNASTWSVRRLAVFVLP